MTLRIIRNILVVGASLVTVAHGQMDDWPDGSPPALVSWGIAAGPDDGAPPQKMVCVEGLAPDSKASGPEAPVTGQPVLGTTPHPGSPPQPGPAPKRRKGLDGMPVPVSPEDQAIILSNPTVKEALGRIGTAIDFLDIRRETNRIVEYLMEKIREGGGSLTEESVAQYIEQNKNVLEQEVFSVQWSPEERTIFQDLLKHSQNPGDIVTKLLNSGAILREDLETLSRNPTDTNLIRATAAQTPEETIRPQEPEPQVERLERTKQSTSSRSVSVRQDFSPYKPVLEQYRITIDILQAFVKDAYVWLTGNGSFSKSLLYSKINDASKQIFRLLEAEATTKKSPLTDAEVAICLHRNPAVNIIEFDSKYAGNCIKILQNSTGDAEIKNEGLVRLLAAGVFKVADLAVAGIPFDEAAKKAAVDFLKGFTGARQKKIAAINFLASGVLTEQELADAGIPFDQVKKEVAIKFLKGLRKDANQMIAAINFLASGVLTEQELADAGIPFDQVKKEVAIEFLKGLKDPQNKKSAAINFLAAGAFSREELASAGINLTEEDVVLVLKAKEPVSTQPVSTQPVRKPPVRKPPVRKPPVRKLPVRDENLETSPSGGVASLQMYEDLHRMKHFCLKHFSRWKEKFDNRQNIARRNKRNVLTFNGQDKAEFLKHLADFEGDKKHQTAITLCAARMLSREELAAAGINLTDEDVAEAEKMWQDFEAPVYTGLFHITKIPNASAPAAAAPPALEHYGDNGQSESSPRPTPLTYDNDDDDL